MVPDNRTVLYCKCFLMRISIAMSQKRTQVEEKHMSCSCDFKLYLKMHHRNFAHGMVSYNGSCVLYLYLIKLQEKLTTNSDITHVLSTYVI